MKAIIFQVFDHFANSPMNYYFFDTCLILSYKKWEENWNSCLKSLFWTLCFYKDRSVFQYMSASRLRNVYLALHCKIDPRRKKDISGYIWHRSFIQMAKCSLLDEEIVYQSFYGAPLMFGYFLLWGKVLCFGMRQPDLCDDYCQRPGRKNYISGYIWHKSFIQTVECSFSNQITVYQSFSGTLLTVSYFLLKEKFCVLADGSASLWLARDVYCLKRSEDLVKKIVSPVMFDTNCSFKQ